MRVAVVGDVHGQWSVRDSVGLDAVGYDLILFVGDLADPLHRRTLTTARALATLRTPALLIPGNHEGTSPWGVLTESIGIGRRSPGGAARAVRRMEALQNALGPVRVVGYSIHPLSPDGPTVLAARPHGMDGRRLAFPQAIGARFGIHTLGGSADRLRALVDRAPGPLIFFAHNGPRGLGRHARAPWAVAGRDLGDPDLTEAILHARATGRQVIAVCGGHVHHDGSDRDWHTVHGGIPHVNAACVPRRRGTAAHHVALTITGTDCSVEAVWIPVP